MRNRNSGFVNFMNKKDAVKAMDVLNGSTLNGYRIRVEWGKRMPKPLVPIYVPPPEHAIDEKDYTESSHIGQISATTITGSLRKEERDHLEHILRTLSLERKSIHDAMTFCLDHIEAGEEIAETIAESLTASSTPIPLKVRQCSISFLFFYLLISFADQLNHIMNHQIARLYLLSDILHNTAGPTVVLDAPLFSTIFESHMSNIFASLNTVYRSPMVGRLTAEQMRERVNKVLDVWIENGLYPEEFVSLWKALFLGNSSGGGAI